MTGTERGHGDSHILVGGHTIEKVGNHFIDVNLNEERDRTDIYLVLEM